MQTLGVKKFLLDYTIGFGLMFLFFYILIGPLPAMDTRVTLKLSQECSLAFPAEEVLQSMQVSLHDGERCEVVSPCDEWQTIHCEGGVSVSGLGKAILGNDLLVIRAKNSPVKSYGVWNYKDASVFKFPISLALLLVAYGIVLVEAGAILFALWRQNKLKQTLSLPSGSRKDQLLKPAFFAMLLAIAVVVINHLFFNLLEHPEAEEREIISTLLKSTSGIFIIVILAPLAEELMFRGVLLRFFIEKKRLVLGTVLVSLLFAAVHGFLEESLGWQLYVSSIYFLLSVFLCRMYIAQQNLWSPIVFHAGYNGTIVILYSLFA